MIFPYLRIAMSFKRIIHTLLLTLIAVPSIAFTQTETASVTDTVFFDDGAVYIGQIADSLFNGRGKMIYADSTVYDGEWKDGLWDGKGELHYPDGDYYNGEFHEHQFCGYGIYQYNNGASYEGYWKDGMFNGAGTMNYADGSIYAGNWEDDMKDGIGVLYDKQTGTLYKGEFMKDAFIGQTWLEDETVEPEFDKNDPSVYFYKRPDSCWHHTGDTYFFVTYGFGQALSFHLDFYTTEHFFTGFAIGINTANYLKGESSVISTDENTSETVIKWDEYRNEILTEETYTMLNLGAQCGYSFKRLSIGATIGVGLRNTVRNCRSLESNDSYFEPGTNYYRTKLTGAKFTYGIHTDYVLKRFSAKNADEFRLLQLQPLVYSLSLRVGYSNVDKVYFGVGISF